MRSKPDIDSPCRPITIDDHVTGVRIAPATSHLVSLMAALPLQLSARPLPLTSPALFVAGECLSTGDVRTPDRAQISAAAARPPVLTQPRVHQDPVAQPNDVTSPHRAFIAGNLGLIEVSVVVARLRQPRALPPPVEGCRRIAPRWYIPRTGRPRQRTVQPARGTQGGEHGSTFPHPSSAVAAWANQACRSTHQQLLSFLARPQRTSLSAISGSISAVPEACLVRRHRVGQ